MKSTLLRLIYSTYNLFITRHRLKECREIKKRNEVGHCTYNDIGLECSCNKTIVFSFIAHPFISLGITRPWSHNNINLKISHFRIHVLYFYVWRNRVTLDPRVTCMPLLPMNKLNKIVFGGIQRSLVIYF